MATPTAIQPADLAFFSTLAGAASLSAAARELGITTAAVSRHLAQMETRLGLALVNRSTRRMSLTAEGQLYRDHARRILADIGEMEDQLGAALASPRGLLRVNATLGFGRAQVAPLISTFVRQHPRVDVRLQLSVNPPPLTDDAFDVCLRFGPPPEARVIARRIAANRRLLCASPAYLARHGIPTLPADLLRHNCIGIRQGEDAYGVWRLSRRQGRRTVTETVRTRGNLTTNDGGIAVQWALDGHGILLRAEWDVASHLARGELIEVLPDHVTPAADIHAVWRSGHRTATRIRVFVDYLARAFRRQRSARA